jgi:hypothetical protein
VSHTMMLFALNPETGVWVKSECTWFVFISELYVLRCSLYIRGLLLSLATTTSFQREMIHLIMYFQNQPYTEERDRLKAEMSRAHTKKDLKCIIFSIWFNVSETFIKNSHFVRTLSWIKRQMINEMQTSAISIFMVVNALIKSLSA